MTTNRCSRCAKCAQCQRYDDRNFMIVILVLVGLGLTGGILRTEDNSTWERMLLVIGGASFSLFCGTLLQTIKDIKYDT